MKLDIDAARVVSELETLARYSESDPPAITRIVFSPPDHEARSWLKTLFGEAGLHVRQDAVGNTFARWIGSDPAGPAVGSGSHIDAIPSAGKYDGTVGVLGGLEVDDLIKIRSSRRFTRAGRFPAWRWRQRRGRICCCWEIARAM